MLRTTLVFTTIVFLTATEVLAAEKPAAPVVESRENSDDKRAQALLIRAVEYYKANKNVALAAYSRAGEFISGDLYVYVVGINGHMLASGGSSSALIGRDISGMRDAVGKPFFREMIDTALTQGTGRIEYRWLNRVDGKIERKVTFFQRVDDCIIAVGFYIPRATPDQARTLLDQAVSAVKTNPSSAFAAFNDLNGKFIQDDLYVFAVDLKEVIFRAHGATPRMVGTDARDLKDPAGKPIIKEMLALLKAKDQGSLEYRWANPVTGKIEKKHTFLRQVNNYLVGVGYYAR